MASVDTGMPAKIATESSVVELEKSAFDAVDVSILAKSFDDTELAQHWTTAFRKNPKAIAWSNTAEPIPSLNRCLPGLPGLPGLSGPSGFQVRVICTCLIWH